MAESSLHGLVTRERRLRLRPDRIDVAGGQLRADVNSSSTSALEGSAGHSLSSLNPVHRDQGIDGGKPLLGFDRVVGVGDDVGSHDHSRAIAGLCGELTATKTLYPGTNLTLVYSLKADR